MTQEQELAKLRADLAQAKRKARQYENRVKVLTNNQRDKERRERTRRLIEHGAILESVLPVKDLDGPEIKALLSQIAALPVVRKVLEPYEKRETGNGDSGHSALLYMRHPPHVCALCEAQPEQGPGCCVANAPYKGSAAPCAASRLSPYSPQRDCADGTPTHPCW